MRGGRKICVFDCFCTPGFELQEYQEKEPELAAQFKRAVVDRKLPENWDEALPKAQNLHWRCFFSIID